MCADCQPRVPFVFEGNVTLYAVLKLTVIINEISIIFTARADLLIY